MNNKTTYLTIDQNYIDRFKLDNSLLNKKIVLYDNRINHILKHKGDFVDEASYELAFNSIEDILKNPDFISENERSNGLEFVKYITENVLVAVTLSTRSELKVRTMYPINISKYNRLKNSTIHK